MQAQSPPNVTPADDPTVNSPAHATTSRPRNPPEGNAGHDAIPPRAEVSRASATVRTLGVIDGAEELDLGDQRPEGATGRFGVATCDPSMPDLAVHGPPSHDPPAHQPPGADRPVPDRPSPERSVADPSAPDRPVAGRTHRDRPSYRPAWQDFARYEPEHHDITSAIAAFQRDHAPLVRQELARLAREGQRPTRLFLACSDSRLVTSMITAGRPGDAFTVRNVGNLVPLPSPSGPDAACDSVAAALEYAVDVLRVRSITVCGHSGCGAMQALLASSPAQAPAPTRARTIAADRPQAATITSPRPRTVRPSQAAYASAPKASDEAHALPASTGATTPPPTPAAVAAPPPVPAGAATPQTLAPQRPQTSGTPQPLTSAAQAPPPPERSASAPPRTATFAPPPASAAGSPQAQPCDVASSGSSVSAASPPHRTRAVETPLGRWLRHGKPSVARLAVPFEPLADRAVEDEVERLCLLNVVQQLEHLMAHPCVARGVAAGELRLQGMYFHMAEAQGYVLDAASGRFEAVRPRAAAPPRDGRRPGQGRPAAGPGRWGSQV
jgi:carbonic anhydrase